MRIEPPGGTYTRYVAPVITASPGSTAFFRTSPAQGWTPSTGTPIALPGSTLDTVTVEFYAQDSSTGLRSPIYSAEYQFDGYIDSDGDGVPDFVELARGIADPTAGGDTDGDGYGDLLEVLEETDPEDPTTDHPSPSDRLMAASAFDLGVSPRSHNTAKPGESDRRCDRGTGVRAFDLAGSLLRQATTDPSAALLENLPASPRDGFVVVATDPNFNVLQGGLVVVPEGRELVGLIPVPDAPFEPLEYVSAGGSANQQAAAWIGQAAAHYQSPQQPQLTEELNLEDTLHLLLFERLLAVLIHAQKPPGFDPDRVTLTPHRDPPPRADRLRTRARTSNLSELLKPRCPFASVVRTRLGVDPGRGGPPASARG